MFTEVVPQSDIAAFELLRREGHFCRDSQNRHRPIRGSRVRLFLWPLIFGPGHRLTLRMRTSRGARARQFLFAAELKKLAEQRPNRLTLVFDQCVGRGVNATISLRNSPNCANMECLGGRTFPTHASSWPVGTPTCLRTHEHRSLLGHTCRRVGFFLFPPSNWCLQEDTSTG